MGNCLTPVPDGVFAVDPEWRITSFNKAAERITGVRLRTPWVADAATCFALPYARVHALKQTLATHQPLVNKVVYIVSATGERVPISISTAILKDARGRVIGGVESFRDLRVVEELRRQAQQQDSFSDIIGRSALMRDLFDLVSVVAASDSTVLIQGASGTGKELVAQAIHAHSRRRAKRFVAINCGGIPDTLLESELFGYKAGAFTDAKKDKPGRFALAEGGTKLLDEIGDNSPAMQTRLLRVLQERVYEPLGSVDPIKADVRIIAATAMTSANSCARAVSERTFTASTWCASSCPPCASAARTSPLLVDHFIARFNRLQGKGIAFPEGALARLMEHDFPGNVRELENVIEHAFVLCRGALIEEHHLPPNLRAETIAGETRLPRGLTLDAMEKLLIRDALQRHGGNRAAAARDLGINASTLFRRLRAQKSAKPPKKRTLRRG